MPVFRPVACEPVKILGEPSMSDQTLIEKIQTLPGIKDTFTLIAFKAFA